MKSLLSTLAIVLMCFSTLFADETQNSSDPIDQKCSVNSGRNAGCFS